MDCRYNSDWNKVEETYNILNPINSNKTVYKAQCKLT